MVAPALISVVPLIIFLVSGFPMVISPSSNVSGYVILNNSEFSFGFKMTNLLDGDMDNSCVTTSIVFTLFTYIF